MIADIVFVIAVALTALTVLISLAVLAAIRAGSATGWNFKSAWFVVATLAWVAWVVIR